MECRPLAAPKKIPPPGGRPLPPPTSTARQRHLPVTIADPTVAHMEHPLSLVGLVRIPNAHSCIGTVVRRTTASSKAACAAACPTQLTAATIAKTVEKGLAIADSYREGFREGFSYS